MTERLLAAALASLAVLTGCGGGDSEEAPPTRQVETVDAVAGLPDEWQVHVNHVGGFAFGLPPGWEARDKRTSTTVRSFDRLAAISITPDRTDGSLSLTTDEFVIREIASLSGYEARLEPRELRRFQHRYAGTAVGAVGTATATGVDQRVKVIALRRDRVAVIAVVIAAADDPQSRPSEQLAERVVRTLRTRPPTVRR